MLHRYDDAIMAIANALASLPTNQIDYMKLLVSQYVRVKTSMVKSGHTDSVIMKRFVLLVHIYNILGGSFSDFHLGRRKGAYSLDLFLSLLSELVVVLFLRSNPSSSPY